MKGMLGTSAVSRIEMVHSTVRGAEDFYYQMWPVDNTNTWTAKFGESKVEKRRWRVVKKLKALSNRLRDVEIAKAQKEKVKNQGTSEAIS